MLHCALSAFGGALMHPYEAHMERAIEEAQKYAGATCPNPPVGALALDAKGAVLGVAAHRKAGGDHAEIALLRIPGVAEKIHTLVVTLEPCVHQGRTGPCVKVIVETGIASVVLGTLDPNPKVMGKGKEYLERAGVSVQVGILEQKCRKLIQSFRKYITTGRPWVVVKRAFLEGNGMFPPPGQKTFSSPEALQYAHERRKRAGAILTSSSTVLADDPLFTVRHVPDYPGKQRFLVVFDRRKRVPSAWYGRTKHLGFEVVRDMDWEEAMEFLGKKGVMEVLVEAGPTFTDFILKQNAWDEQINIVVGEKEEKIFHKFQER